MYSEQISIHSARVGGDLVPEVIKKAFNYFNPLRPCGRRPARRLSSSQTASISIHSARVGGDVWKNERTFPRLISIHSARVGGDD